MGVAPNYVMNKISLEEVKEINDLDVFYNTLLVFDKHICERINKAYMMLGIIKKNFTYISRKCFIILYKSLVNNNNNNVLYYNCRQTLQRTISNICHAGQYTIIDSDGH